MSHLQRFKFLALPVLIWTVIGVSSVLFIRWMLEYFLEAVQINQSIWDYWIPFAFAIIVWFVVLRPRFKLFYNPKWKNNQETFIFMAINVFIALSIMFGEFVMEYAVLKKKWIDNVTEIDMAEWNTCYEIKELEWDPDKSHLYQTSEVTGRNNDKIHYYNYLTVPIKSGLFPDTLIWLGKEYHISFSNRESQTYKNERWNSFYEESIESFKLLTKMYNEYLMPVQKSGKLNNYISAIERYRPYKKYTHRVFEFSSLDTNAAANSKLIWFSIFIFMTMVSCYFISLLPVVDHKGMKNYLAGKHTITPDEKEVRNVLMMRGKYKVMPAVGYLIIIVYVLAASRDGNLFSIQSDTSMDFGAMQKIAFEEGEYWRMLTSMFSHASFMHLFGNLVLLVILGLAIEPYISHLRFLVLIILCGFGGEIVSYYHIAETTISLGASGFVFGLFGWYIIQTYVFKKLKDEFYYSLILIPMMAFSFFYGLVVSGVNNAAHIGGFFTGVLLAFLIRPTSKYKNR